jgi:predicted phage terminase large subunit-like protein
VTCPAHPALSSALGACPVCGPRVAAPVPEFAPLPWAAPTAPAPTAPSAVLEARRAEEAAAYAAGLAARARAELKRRTKARCLGSLAEFLRAAWHTKHGGKELEWSPVLQVMCDTVQRWLEGWLGKYADGRAGTPLHVQNMLFNLPPGTLKSEIVMVFAPAWLWLHEPRCSFGAISGNPDNVKRDSDAHQNLVQSAWYRETFGVSWDVSSDVAAVGKWATSRPGDPILGERVSRGISASAVGLHVDILLIDDPDDIYKVHSPAARREVKGQFEALGNRLQSMSRSLIGVVQQRAHPDDLSSELIAKGWPRLCLRATHHPGKLVPTPWDQYPDWREVEGESLHPTRLTPEVLAKEKVRLGSAGYNAQYEQEPEEEGGNKFKRGWWGWFRLEDSRIDPAWKRPEGSNMAPARVLKIRRGANGTARPSRGTIPDYGFDRVVVTVDATFGSKSSAASRVGILGVGIIGADRFILRDRTRKADIKETIDLISDLVYDLGATKVIVERKANGQAVVDLMKGEISGMVLVDPEGGKESRAAAMEPAVESGNWYLLEGADYLDSGHDEDDDGLLDEVSTFPRGKKDDRVDAMSQLEAEEHGKVKNRLRDGWKW